MEAATEVAATTKKVATAEVKALMKAAEFHGHMMTVAESEEWLRLEEEFDEQQELKLWRGCGETLLLPAKLSEQAHIQQWKKGLEQK